jgi:hypothetical protein
MKYFIFISLLLVISVTIGCKKEGLSKDTGNLEVSFQWGDGTPRPYIRYSIYSEEQYYQWIQNLVATPYRSGGSGVGVISEKSLPKGNYGIVIWIDETWRSQKIEYVASNKVNKFFFP